MFVVWFYWYEFLSMLYSYVQYMCNNEAVDCSSSHRVGARADFNVNGSKTFDHFVGYDQLSASQKWFAAWSEVWFWSRDVEKLAFIQGRYAKATNIHGLRQTLNNNLYIVWPRQHSVCLGWDGWGERWGLCVNGLYLW